MENWIDTAIKQAMKFKDANVSWLDGSTPIYIYGTGSFARIVHQVLIDAGLPVFGFIDHTEHESPFLYGTRIYTPEKAAENNNHTKKGFVILGIHNYQAKIQEITSRLVSVGFTKILTSIDLYDYFGHQLGIRYWLTSRDYYFSLKPILLEMFELLADEASQSLFQSIIEFRLTGDVTRLPIPDLINPYRPIDIPRLTTPLRFVDCGAFDGDTLADFIRNNIPIQSVSAFEPDLANFKKLSYFVTRHRKELPEVNLFPCGVYSSTKQVVFETGQGMASTISHKGTAIIQCVALDEAIPTFAPNFIKMDIEGAEYDALLGARQIIITYVPRLAISLYHRPEHLWQVPMLIETIAPEKYKFYIRSHALNDFELVLYAIPKG